MINAIYFTLCLLLGLVVGISFGLNDWKFYFLILVPHLMAFINKTYL